MATAPPLTRDQVQSFLAQWKTHQHSAEEEEEFEALDVIRGILERVKTKCPAAAEACDAELEMFERQLAATLLEEATALPVHKQKIPRSDTNLFDDASAE